MKSPETYTQKLSFSKRQKLGAVAGMLLALAIPSSSSDNLQPLRPDVNIKILGDSIGAASGAGNYEPGTVSVEKGGNNCLRSVEFSNIFEEVTGVHPENYACLGMSPDSFSDPNTGQGSGSPEKREPSQLDQITEDTDVIILSIGANVINLAELFKYVNNNPSNPDDPVMRRALEEVKSKKFKQAVKLSYDEVLKRAPHAHVYVMEYNNPITNKKMPYHPDVLGDYEDEYVRQLVEAINATIRRVIKNHPSDRLVLVENMPNSGILDTLVGTTTSGEAVGHPTKDWYEWVVKVLAREIIKHQPELAAKIHREDYLSAIRNSVTDLLDRDKSVETIPGPVPISKSKDTSLDIGRDLPDNYIEV